MYQCLQIEPSGIKITCATTGQLQQLYSAAIDLNLKCFERMYPRKGDFHPSYNDYDNLKDFINKCLTM